jgi:hypothetical protein
MARSTYTRSLRVSLSSGFPHVLFPADLRFDVPELVTPKEGEWEQMRKTVNTVLAANAGAEPTGR